MSWEFELVAGPFGSPTDGPLWDGGALLFTQAALPALSRDNRILRYDPESGAITDFRLWTNRTMGLALSRDGVLYGAQSGGRRIVRFNVDGTAEALAHKLDGVYHNQPKELVIDSQDRIWFTDRHGDLRDAANPQIHDKLDHASVLRMDGPAREHSPIRRMTYDTDAPAALLLSHDEQTLYVAESSDDERGERELRAYPVLGDGTLGPCFVLHAFGVDHRGVHRGVQGMCLDSEGNIVACAGWDRSGPGSAIYVFSPTGLVLEAHPCPAEPTNCTFGDADLASLYVTTIEGQLLRVRGMGRRG